MTDWQFAYHSTNLIPQKFLLCFHKINAHVYRIVNMLRAFFVIGICLLGEKIFGNAIFFIGYK